MNWKAPRTGYQDTSLPAPALSLIENTASGMGFNYIIYQMSS